MLPAVEHHRRCCRQLGIGQAVALPEVPRDARVSLRPHRLMGGGGNGGRLTEATAGIKLRYSMAGARYGARRRTAAR